MIFSKLMLRRAGGDERVKHTLNGKQLSHFWHSSQFFNHFIAKLNVANLILKGCWCNAATIKSFINYTP